MPWKDLRREQRHPYFESVLLRWEEDGVVYSVRGSCLNLSRSGLAVEAFEPLPDGGEIQCSVLSLKQVANARVRHRHRRLWKNVLGLEFDEPLEFNEPVR